MSKHKHPKSKKAKSSAKKASAPANGGTVNWHRIIWELSQPTAANDPHSYFKNHFFASGSGKSNQFWLEPEVYTDPPVTIGKFSEKATFQTNCLCFRTKFLGEDMTAPWKDCLFFPHPKGVKPLKLTKKTKEPIINGNTERLVGLTRTSKKQGAILILCMDTTTKLMHIKAAEHGLGHHLGAGVAHQ